MFLPYPSDAAAVADAGTEALRVPPYSLEAEQAVLGGLMLDNAAWDTVADRGRGGFLPRRSPADLPRHPHAFRRAGFAARCGHAAEWLERSALSRRRRRPAVSATLARDTPSAANIRAYADIVRERWCSGS